MSLVKEHISLTNGILSGKISKADVETAMDRIEKEYGESAFNLYKVEKKPAPWTQGDLDDLEIQSASGACSKEFYLYMAEVSDYVHRNGNKNKIFAFGEKILKFIIKNWLKILAGIVFALILWLVLSKIFG